MNNISDLVKISKYAGERFDLVQASGGNASIKTSDRKYMWIKSSGYLLSEVETNYGYCKVDNDKVLDIMTNKKNYSIKKKSEREKKASKLLSLSATSNLQKPSIETYMHSLLGTYVLHTHPVVVNILTSRKFWRKELISLFNNPLLIDYKTPGLELGLELNKQLFIYEQKYGQKPKIVFLQNHGLIVTSEDTQELYEISEKVLIDLERYLKIDMDMYKLTTKISNLLGKVSTHKGISYLSTETNLNELLRKDYQLFSTKAFCPDRMVFCGYQVVKIKNVDDYKSIKTYYKKYQQLPKVIILKNHLFFIAPNIKKAREIEEVLKMHVMVVSVNKNSINYLTDEELFYLDNWEAEKHRQKI